MTYRPSVGAIDLDYLDIWFQGGHGKDHVNEAGLPVAIYWLLFIPDFFECIIQLDFLTIGSIFKNQLMY